jgi:hypothetical protein
MTPLELGRRVLRAVQARAESSRFSNRPPVPAPDPSAVSRSWIQKGTRVVAAPYICAADRIAEGWLDVFALRDVDMGSPPRWNRDPKTGIEAPIAGWVSRAFDARQPAPAIVWRARLTGRAVLRTEMAVEALS